RIFLTGGYRNPHGKHKLVVSGSPERPYYVPFQSVIMQSVLRIKRKDWRVNFVFDQQNVFSGFATALYEHTKITAPTELIRNQLGGLMYESHHDELPLQAADLLAHCSYRVRPPSPGTLPPDVVTALQVIEEKGYFVHAFTKEEMDKYLDNAGHHIPTR